MHRWSLQRKRLLNPPRHFISNLTGETTVILHKPYPGLSLVGSEENLRVLLNLKAFYSILHILLLLKGQTPCVLKE